MLVGAPYALGLGLPFVSEGSSSSTPLFTILQTGFGQAILGQSSHGHGVYGLNGVGNGIQPLFAYDTGVWGDSDNGNGPNR